MATGWQVSSQLRGGPCEQIYFNIVSWTGEEREHYDITTIMNNNNGGKREAREFNLSLTLLAVCHWVPSMERPLICRQDGFNVAKMDGGDLI